MMAPEKGPNRLNMKFTNSAAAGKLINPPYREGWTL